MEAKIYPKKTHHIDFSQIDAQALYILEKLRKSHYAAFLVGGSVRDLLLKQTPKDFDISTSAKPEEIKRLFPSAILIGKRFRLAHVRFGKKIIEVSTFRSGNIETEELIREDNIWGTPEEDVLRRDFTINGLLYDSEKEEVIDYVGGYLDIKEKILRVIGLPFQRFKQDPVRMIRCLKFQARFGLKVQEDIRLALTECKGELTKSAPARVLEEILRMLESGHAREFFKLMVEHQLMKAILPTLSPHLQLPNGAQIYALLKEVDVLMQKPSQNNLERPTLLACLAFPLMEDHLKTTFIDQGQIPHLGDIYREGSLLIDAIFHPFLKIPRRLKIQALAVLISQYRMTPFQKKKITRIRIPRAPDFHLALQFFDLRCRLNPKFEKIRGPWEKEYEKTIQGVPEVQKRRKKFQEARKK